MLSKITTMYFIIFNLVSVFFKRSEQRYEKVENKMSLNMYMLPRNHWALTLKALVQKQGFNLTMLNSLSRLLHLRDWSPMSVTFSLLSLPLFSYLKILLDWKIRPKCLEWRLKWKEVCQGLTNFWTFFECYKTSMKVYLYVSFLLITLENIFVFYFGLGF